MDSSRFHLTRYRSNVIRSNMAFIDAENRKNHSYTLGITPFIYLTSKEFASYVSTRGLSDSSIPPRSAKCLNRQQSPSSVDWRKRGILSPITNQGDCGSCYAMATAELTATALRLAGKKVDPLSSQQIVDCSHAYGNSGCSGGSLLYSMKYINSTGLVPDTEYPYLGKETPCAVSGQGRFRASQFKRYSDIDETSLQSLVASGPVSVAIYGSWEPLQVAEVCFRYA